LVDVKVIVGKCSASKKSAERRCSSRFTSPLSRDWTLTVASTEDWFGSSAMTTVPPLTPNRPRTLLIIRCRPVKVTPEWVGSIR
jgi:hypothetical protein